MNGRMYDPQQGRFLSPDNHIQDPFNTQNFNRYGYVLNNPLSLTDPSGEFLLVAVAIGAFFGGASAAIQGGDFWDILGGALIGGIAGGIGAGVSNLAAGALGLSSTGGAAAGFFGNAALSAAGAGFNVAFQVAFAGGFAAGFVGTAGNALIKGQKFGKSLLMGLKAGFFSGVAAGVTAGVGAGFRAKKAGGDFWTGEGATFEILAPPGTPTEVAQDLEYSNEFARDFSDKYISEPKGLNELYANGSFPEGYTLKGNGVFNPKGQEILGVTKSLGGGQSNVYLAQKAFSSKELLYMTIKHEYIHVELINAGFNISQYGKAHHASIYRWQYEQALEFGMNSFDYLHRAIRYETFFNPAVDRFMPNILTNKPW
jgi:hypothetical protein